jgi:hypothetical protein
VLTREKRFEELCMKATDDRGILVTAIDGGHEHKLVKIVLEKSVLIRGKKTLDNPKGIEDKVLTGTLVLEISSVDWGFGPKPVLYVIESDFGPIPRGGQLFLPLIALANPKWCSPFADERADWQMELREALQWACARELEARRQTYLARKHTEGEVLGVKKSVVPLQTEKALVEAVHILVEEPMPTPTVARALKIEHIAGKAKHWTGGNNFFFSAGPRGLAYFTRVVDGGAKKLVFHNQHKAIMVDIDPILKCEVEHTGGDLHDVRVARVVVQNYLRVALCGKLPDYDPLELRGVYDQGQVS